MVVLILFAVDPIYRLFPISLLIFILPPKSSDITPAWTADRQICESYKKSYSILLYNWHSTNQTQNCNYILFTKLPWPGDSEGTFRSLSQAATCPPVYHTRRRLHTVPFNAERQAGKLWIPIFIVFGLTRPGIEPESTASVADALSTRQKRKYKRKGMGN